MDKIEKMAIAFIATLKRCDKTFSNYWNGLSKIDREEIMEELQDTIYDWVKIDE